jgi:malic enzyme-like protein
MVREGLSVEQATRRFWALDRKGLLTEDRTEGMRGYQVPYAQPAGEVPGWADPAGAIGLAEVLAHAKPTILIGTSTQPGAFSEPIVRTMAAHVERPIILPLSNPTSRRAARPEHLIGWTDGRALVATGSPFPPVEHDRRRYRIAQANNALVFPGLGLGVAVSRARRVSTSMLAAAADAVAELSDASKPGAPLLPPVDDLRLVSAAVGLAVAKAAVADGLAQVELHDPVQQVHQAMWRPEYRASRQSDPAAPPDRDTDTHDRVWHDRIDDSGCVTLRVAGRLHHLGIGRTHVVQLVQDLHVRVVNAATGELVRELTSTPPRTTSPSEHPKAPPQNDDGPNPQPWVRTVADLLRDHSGAPRGVWFHEIVHRCPATSCIPRGGGGCDVIGAAGGHRGQDRGAFQERGRPRLSGLTAVGPRTGQAVRCRG